MKFRITFKDPDGIFNGLTEAVNVDMINLDLSIGEKRLVRESRLEELQNKIDRWIEYGEYITIEFDTDAGTATVVPR